ncbi:MAG: ABC transporter ATP-binding protein [Sulfobacillus sp.]
MAEVLLKVEDLATHFPTDSGEVRAVDGIDLEVRAGETLGIVGESGCGKSVTALSIMRLITKPGYLARGRIEFQGRDLATLSDAEMRDVRGNEIAMIFQEPMTSLNPVYTVGDQISESICLHLNKTRSEAREMTIELFRRVGIPLPDKRVDEFPHQLSGGMRQRVMIAMALACNPKLLIADEPTTALDVTIQAQILDLMRRLRQEFGMSIIIITHDLGVVAEMADRVAVMYAGNIVETTDVRSLFAHPEHPYTEGLLRSIPRLDQDRSRLHVIPGTVPNMLELPTGCRFQNRCSYVRPACREAEPELIARPPDGRLYRCIVPPAERTQEEAS